MESVQHLGRSLMLPIAVLPIAGLLLRVGQPDLLDIPFIAAAGQALFSNLGLLFAMGVAIGFARENHGAAGLAGVVGYLVATQGAAALIVVPPEIVAQFPEDARALGVEAYKQQALSRLGVPMGILNGALAGFLYNRYADIKLPDYLAFFGGRRFVPIASGLAGLLIAGALGLGWTHIVAAIDAFSRTIVDLGGIGLFLYGVLNRVLIVTGLHHILNNVAWFIVGDYKGVSGDLNRFFAGDPAAGSFMAGFFPVMMFGLPAACLAMYHAARPERKKAVGGMLLSMALTSFLTGVTEPIEFTFMFLAPVLYAVHAVLTGISMVLMDALGVKLGFGFSAGLFDYLINFKASTRPLMLLAVGAAYFGLYYGMFRLCIAWLDLKTPGREADAAADVAPRRTASGAGPAYVAALGGAENLSSVDACTTRLRLIVADRHHVDEAALKRLGVKGLIWPSENAVQIVIGPTADETARAIRDALRMAPARTTPLIRTETSDASGGAEVGPDRAREILSALGGAANVKAIEATFDRLCARLADSSAVDATALKRAGVRGLARPSRNSAHLLGLPNPGRLAAALGKLV
jgi:PTS system N-acetylglucosamine-specific IIC component